jgi:dynein heavy chain
MNDAKNTLIGMCLTDLNRLERQKIEAVITIYVHLMEVFRDIVKITKKLEEFNWQKQARFYWLEEYDNCIISITDVGFR